MISSNFLVVLDFDVIFDFLSGSNSSLGFYRGIAPGITGSLATGATYFGVIESSKKWIEETHPSLGGHWAHFIAGAVGKQGSLTSITRCLLKKFNTNALITMDVFNPVSL